MNKIKLEPIEHLTAKEKLLFTFLVGLSVILIVGWLPIVIVKKYYFLVKEIYKKWLPKRGIGLRVEMIKDEQAIRKRA